MARDATARLYDVDAASVRLNKEAGTIMFQARKGRLVDLDRLHESIWATRLGDSTGMVLKRLEVKAAGEVVVAGKEVVLKIPGGEQSFLLEDDPDAPPVRGERKNVLKLIQEAVKRGGKVVSVTGRVDGWTGNFTKLLSTLPGKPRRILVSDFETAKP